MEAKTFVSSGEIATMVALKVTNMIGTRARGDASFLFAAGPVDARLTRRSIPGSEARP